MLNLSVPKIPKVNYALPLFLRDVWGYLAGFRRRLLFWLILYFFGAAISLLTPVLTGKIVDNLTTGSTQYITYLVTAIFIVEYGRIIYRNRVKFQVFRLAEKCRLSSRQSWISSILSFDLKWHETQNSGKKISILTRGSEQLRGLIRFFARGGGGIDILINILGILLIFFKLDLKYAFLALVNIVSYSILIIVQTRKLNYRRHALNRLSDRIMGKNFDFFSNMLLIKSLGIGPGINRLLFKKESHYIEKNIEYSRLEYNKWIYINTISQICSIITLIFIVTDISSGRISLGSFFIYSGYMSRLQDGLGSLAEWIEDLVEKYLALYRVRQLIHSGTTITQSGKKPFPENLTGITISNLHFAYQSHPILNGINLKFTAGQKYGLVGLSGSGKSTLSKLLLKLYLPQKGAIFYNQSPLNSINSDSLHDHISVAPQESEIFNLSFRENITIASSRKFNQRRYDLAIKTSECQPILDKIKNNHQTLLGEKGVKLSGGERQRLGIARAIYKNTPVIIFDESTSSLDSKTEAKILNNLEKYFASHTIFWIAHRLSTLRFTDEIIVFDQGQVVEQGNFKKLISLRGHFFTLWSIQKKTNLR